MNEFKWEETKPVLYLYDYCEECVHGDYTLSIHRQKPDTLNPLMDKLFGGLTEKEMKLVNIRRSTDPSTARRDNMKKGRESHPYNWSINRNSNGIPTPLTHIGGQAKTIDDAKERCQTALRHFADLYEKMVDLVES